MRHSRSRYSSRRQARSRGGVVAWIKLALVLVALLLVLWGVVKFFGWIFGATRSEAMALTVVDLSGPAEFQIKKDEDFVPVYSDQLLYAGDRIRTKNNSQMGLQIVDSNNLVHMDYNTELVIQELEEKSNGERHIVLELSRGRIWGHIDGLLLSENDKSRMVVISPMATTHILGTMFVVEAGTGEDLVRVMEGRVTVEVAHTNDEGKQKRVETPVSVGQQIRLSEQSIAQIAAGEDILEKLDTEFITSEWHLYNLEQFNPEEAQELRGTVEAVSEPIAADPTITAPETDTPPALPTSSTLEPIEFTSPQEGATVEAKTDDLVVVSGIAPEGAAEIWVGNYKLNLFRPGDRKWRYFAKAEFDTLRNGENSYTVYAVDALGQRSESRTLTFLYEGAAESVPTTENVAPVENAENTTIAPEVSTEAVINPIEFVYPKVSPFETSASKVTIRGTVDPSVTSVEVNGYRLKQFQPGSGVWKYLANADMGNMDEGENTFTVRALVNGSVVNESHTVVVYRPMDSVPGQE